MRPFALFSSTLLVAAITLSACNSTPKLGHFVALPGVSGSQIWSFGFDSKSHALVGGYGGMWRYSEADGWLKVGTFQDNTLFVIGFFPAADGGTYAATFGPLYKLELGAAQWTKVKDGVGNVYVSPDGTTPTVAGNARTLVDNAGNVYAFPREGNDLSGIRQDAATGATRAVFDCHTKQFFQCSAPITPLQFDNQGSLYFGLYSAFSGASVFRVPASGGTPTLVAAMPYGDPPNDYVYFTTTSITADGTVYMTGKRSSDAYSYGSTFRFTPGDTKGAMFLASPSDFDTPAGITTAPEANIAVAPDGTMYSYLPVHGAVSRYTP